MAEPSMDPDELAWAFQNAGRTPAAQRTTSEAFASQARERELKVLEHKNQVQQHAQDQQYNQAVHAQDMAAARAHHNALMGEYSLLNTVKGAFMEQDADQKGFRNGFFWGIVAGVVAIGLFKSR